jgi:zinc transport system permease protein
MEDFLLRALLGGLGVALVAGPIGCVVVWRRMVYFGAALSHSALLGVALGFLLGIDFTIGILALCLVLAALLLVLERQSLLPTDTLLGVLAHVALAAGIVIVTFLERLRVDLMAYLFGDILAVSATDIYLIYAMSAVVLGTLVWLWRDLLSLTVNEDLAAVEGVPVARVRAIFVLLIAAVVAIGMKVVGILLILSLIIIPAAAARPLARSPEQMAVLSTLIAAGAVVAGLVGSFQWDVPSGPMIVIAAALGFVVTACLPRGGRTAGRPRPGALGR